jgi:hypothetical protein
LIESPGGNAGALLIVGLGNALNQDDGMTRHKGRTSPQVLSFVLDLFFLI